jgi:hypothetical protein
MVRRRPNLNRVTRRPFGFPPFARLRQVFRGKKQLANKRKGKSKKSTNGNNSIPAAYTTTMHKPYSRMRQVKDGIIVEGKDYFTTVKSAVLGNAPGDNLVSVDLTLDQFPSTRIKVEKNLWQNWKVEKLQVHYIPQCGTGTTGSLIGAVLQDPEDPLALGDNNKRFLMSVAGASAHPVYTTGTYTAHRLSRTLFTDDLEGEERFFSPGIIRVAAMSSLDGATSYGDLWISYRIKFWNASNKSPDTGYAIYLATGINSTTDTSHPLNLSRTGLSKTQDSDFSLLNVSGDTTSLDFTGLISVGQYVMVNVHVDTGSTATSANSWSGTNLSPATYSGHTSLTSSSYSTQFVGYRASTGTCSLSLATGSSPTALALVQIVVIRMKSVEPYIATGPSLFTNKQMQMMKILFNKLKLLGLDDLEKAAKQIEEEEETIVETSTFRIVETRPDNNNARPKSGSTTPTRARP